MVASLLARHRLWWRWFKGICSLETFGIHDKTIDFGVPIEALSFPPLENPETEINLFN